MRLPLTLTLTLTLALLLGCGPSHTGHQGHHGHDARRFEDPERWAKRWDDPARDAWQRPAEVVAAIGVRPGMSVADLGAGTGYFLPHLAQAVGPEGRVEGLDIEAAMVGHMQQRIAKAGWTNVSARQVAGDDPELADGSVDRVLIVNTWHHIPDRAAYVARLARALRPGGLVAIVDYTPASSKGPKAEHKLTTVQVANELREGGLVPEVLETSLPEQYIVVGRKRSSN